MSTSHTGSRITYIVDPLDEERGMYTEYFSRSGIASVSFPRSTMPLPPLVASFPTPSCRAYANVIISAAALNWCDGFARNRACSMCQS